MFAVGNGHVFSCLQRNNYIAVEYLSPFHMFCNGISDNSLVPDGIGTWWATQLVAVKTVALLSRL